MARTIGTKKAKDRKEEPGINTAGQLDYSELIKTSLENFSVTQAMQMAAFFTGKGTEVKTAKQAQNKASQAQPSVLGKTNSIYQTLQSLRNSIKTSLSINDKGIGGKIKLISNKTESIEDLFNILNNKILINLNNELINLNNKIDDVLIKNTNKDNNLKDIKFPEDIAINNLSEIKIPEFPKSIDINNLSEIKIPEFPEDIAISNLSEIKIPEFPEFPESIAINNLSDIIQQLDNKNLDNILKCISELPKPEIKIPEFPKDIAISNLSEIKIPESIAINNLSDIMQQLDDKNLDNILKRISELQNYNENLSEKLTISLESGDRIHKSFEDTAKKNQENIQKIIDSYTEQINTYKDYNKEELQNLINTFITHSNQNIENIKEEIHKDKSDIVRGKLLLTIGGIDNLTIDTLIKFSDLNLDKLDQNAQSLIIFFKSLKTLEKFNIKKSLNVVSDLDQLLFSITTSLGILKFTSIDESIIDKIQSLNTILNSFDSLFITLKTLSDKKVDAKNVLNGIIGINGILMTLTISAPMFLMVNEMYGKHKIGKWSIGIINLNDTTKIFKSFGELFKELDNIKTSNNIKQLVGSFGSLFIMLESIMILTPLLGSINLMYNSEVKNGDKFGINLQKTSEILIDFNSLIFDVINNMSSINNGLKILKSFMVFPLIAGGLKTSLLTISTLKLGDLDNKKLFMTSVALKNISIVFDIINKMKTLDKDAKKKIDDVARLFGDPKTNKKGQYNKYINTSLVKILENISKTEIPENTSLTGISNFITDIKTIIDSLNSINISKNTDEIGENLDNYIKLIEESYKKFQEKFDQIIATGDTAEKIKAANEKIANAMESIDETIVKTSANEKDIKKSVIAMEGITEFMISAALVMSIGALIVMWGGGKFVKAALEFGIVLSIFEGLVLLPALMFYQQQESAMKGIEGFNSFIITCTITMGIGALFMALGGGKFVKRSLEFGVLLFMFETLTVMPMLMFLDHKTDIFNSMADFSKFVIIATIVMSVGSLFVSLGGGKFVRNALKFGVALAEFEFMVVAPFLLFRLIGDKASEGVKEFTSLLITTTILFLIGSGIMALSGGKMVKYSMMFAETLMKFEAMIIAPFLIFNFLKKSVFDGLKAFTSVLIVCTTTLLIGAMFMNMKGGVYQLSAMEFAWLLLKFEAMIIAPFLLFNIIQKQVFKGLRDFAVVVFVATTTLLIGALFMSMNNGMNGWYAIEFAGVLLIFETALLAPIMGFGKLGGKPLKNAREFGLFVALCSFSLIIGAAFINQYGAEPAVKFAVLLGTFIGGMSWVVMWLSEKFKDRKTIKKAQEFGIFVLLCSTALIIGATFVNKYGVGPVLAFGTVLVTFVGLMSAVVFGLNKMFESTGGVEKPIALMVAMGTFLMLATGSLALGAWVVDTYGWKALAFVPLLMTFVVGVGAIFALIGLPPFFALIGLGAIAATAMGVALLALTGSIMVVNLLFELDPGGKKTRKNIETLNNDVLAGGVIWTFTLLGLLSPLIIPGGLAAIAMGVAMMALGGSLLIINTCVDKVKDTILGNIGTLSLTIGAIGLLGLELLAMTVPLALGLPGLALLNVFSLGLTTSILMMYGSIKAMQSVGGDLTQQIDLITKNLQAFIDIPNKISLGGKNSIPFLGAVWNGGKLFALNLMMSDIAGIVKNAAYAIREIQSLKFNENFDQIQKKIFEILTTMPQSFLDVYDGKDGGKGLKDIGQYKLDRVITFSENIGKVIASVAEGVGNMAKLQIPIGWDKNGNPISFRRLNDKDFTLAGDNVAKILTTMAAALGHLWNNEVKVKIGDFDYTLNGGLQELLEDKDSSFFNMISFSKQIGEVISGVAEGVASMAKLKIPTSWDMNGKPTGYKSLKDKDFIDASFNTQLILSTIITSMAGLYESHRNDPGGNIFDMEDNWFTEDSPSPIMKVIETSFKISELLGNLGGGIKSIATLQIPTKWDSNGKPIWYEKLNITDFTNAGQAVGQIVTCLIDALNKESYINNADDIKKVLDSVMPVSELISDMADGIIKLSSGLVADEWNDPKNPGKATHYKRLEKADYVRSGQAIARIVTCITNALIKAYNGEEGKNNGLKSILESDSFKEIVESVASTGDLISNIADSIIKIGSAQIPIYKNGKIDHYDPINIPEAKNNLRDIVREIMLATVNSIIDVYNGIDGKDGLKLLLNDENSPFLQATKGINEIMQSVSTITDSIIKLGSAQIPVYINGKLDHYKAISVKDTVTNIKEIFEGENGNGLLTILCSSIKDIANQYFNPNDENKNISGAVSSVYNGIHQITEIIKDTSDIVTNIGNMKFPTGFDNDGKPTGYDTVDKTVMEKAKNNIVEVMTSILSIFDINSTDSTDPKKPNLNRYLTGDIISDDNKNKIIKNLNNTKDIISSLFVIIKDFNTYGAEFTKILKYKGSGIKADKNISLPILNDAYIIINAFDEFNSAFTKDIGENQNLSKIAGSIESIGSNITRIITKVSEISKVIVENKLSEISKNFDGNSLATSLSTIINGFNVIYKTITSPAKSDNGKYVLIGSLDQNTINQVGLNISTISSLANTLIDNYIKNSEKIENINIITGYDKKLEGIKDFYVKVISVIQGINDELLNNIKIQVKEGDNTNQMMRSISDFISSGINPFDSEMFDKFDHLNTSINDIYETIARQEDHSKSFNKNTNALQTYIKAINGVDLKKVSSLSTLVDGLNKLAGQLGNLDRLTDTIANNLAEVLKDLVDSLDEAKKTITSAHELQEFRAKQIDKAITNVKSLMKAPLNVNIQSANQMSNNGGISTTNDEDKDKNTTTVNVYGGDSGGKTPSATTSQNTGKGSRKTVK